MSDSEPLPTMVTTEPTNSFLECHPTDSSYFDVTDLGAITDEQRYKILTQMGPKLKQHPSNSHKRCFQPQWSESFVWIRYSVLVDGVFCAPCFLFSKAGSGEFVSTPFRNWKNVTGASHGALNRHSASHTHQYCVGRQLALWVL